MSSMAAARNNWAWPYSPRPRWCSCRTSEPTSAPTWSAGCWRRAWRRSRGCGCWWMWAPTARSSWARPRAPWRPPPAGPAFEGAQIRDGMRASTGAIEAVQIGRDGVRWQVIGDVPPVGLCGSGLVDAVAQLRLAGLLRASGQLLSSVEAAEAGPELARRLALGADGVLAFVLAWPHETGHGRAIVLTQRDIRELQFAKGAIASGIEVMLRELGVTAGELAEIYLAGSFGSYINPQSARIIGLVPPVPVERIVAVGNAAGEGAKIALLSFREREVARAIPRQVEYHELSGRTDFNDAFVSVLQFPELAELGLAALPA